MFILRRITSDGHQRNEVLGSHYNTVFEWQKEEPNKKDFKDLLEPWPAKEEIFGFVVFRNGSEVAPLYRKSTYFVMCSDGKTFDKIEFR